MQRNGVQQKHVAERLGLSKWHVCHVLNGDVPSARVVATAKALITEKRRAKSPRRSLQLVPDPAVIAELSRVGTP